MFNVGLDLGKCKSQICVQRPDGTIVAEKRINTTRDELRTALSEFRGATVLVESSTSSEWVARLLESLGCKVVVADPRFSPMYAQKNKRVKTDKRDARALADALRMNAFQPAHRKSDGARRLFGLLKARAQLVRKRTSYVTFVRAQCERDGVILPRKKAGRFELAIEAVHIEAQLFEIIAPILVVINALNVQIKECDEQLEREAKQRPAASLLQTVPGVGPLTALAFIAAIDEPKRFKSPREVSAYLGLVPGERNSGDSKRAPGAITKAGDVLARSYLVEAGLSLTTRHAPATPLKSWAENIARRGGTASKKRAAVAVARRLARILWAMWRDNKPFIASRTRSSAPAAAVLAA